MTASAIRLCRRSRKRTAVCVSRPAPLRAGTNSQGTAASTAGTAHTPSAQRQPSAPTAAAIGAVATAAAVAPSAIAVL